MRFSIYSELQSWPGKSYSTLYGEVLEQIEIGLAGTPARPRPAGRTALTPRQLEIPLLLSGVASTDQIASELFIATETVRNHIRRILMTLQVHSRLAAVAKARQLGLIDD